MKSLTQAINEAKSIKLIKSKIKLRRNDSFNTEGKPDAIALTCKEYPDLAIIPQQTTIAVYLKILGEFCYIGTVHQYGYCGVSTTYLQVSDLEFIIYIIRNVRKIIAEQSKD